MDVISISALILSLLGNILINAHKISAYPIWIISNVLWIIINLQSNPNISQMIMFGVYIFTNTLGWIQWYKYNKK